MEPILYGYHGPLYPKPYRTFIEPLKGPLKGTLKGTLVRVHGAFGDVRGPGLWGGSMGWPNAGGELARRGRFGWGGV